MRFGLMGGVAMIVFSLGGSGCATLQVDRPTAVTASDWLTDGQTPLRNRVLEVTIAPPLEKIWEYNANGAFGPGSPLLLGDLVLVGTLKGEIHSIDIETGRSRGYKEFGEAIEGSPLIAGGIVYVPMAWGGKVLAAYDLKTASFKWRRPDIPIETALIKVDDAIVGVNVEGVMKSYDMATGEIRWQLELQDAISVHATPVAFDDGRIFVVTDRGMAAMVDGMTGELLWSTRLAAPVYESPAAQGDLIVAPTTRGLIQGIDANTGAIRWTRRLGPESVRIGAVALTRDRVYVGSTAAQFVALDAASGNVIWQRNIPDAITAAPLVTRDFVYFGSMGNWIYGVDRTDGTIVLSNELKGRIKSAMAAAKGGLIVLTEPRYVVYFRPVGASALAGDDAVAGEDAPAGENAVAGSASPAGSVGVGSKSVSSSSQNRKGGER